MDSAFDPAQDRLRFLFVLHNHQPLGNFDGVIQTLMERAYRPLLEAVGGRPAIKLTLHLSGPLLLWLERRASDYLDLVGELVQRGQAELLMGGLYEPVLAAISHEDRVTQIDLMGERIRSRFGVRPRGLWLAERVWDAAIIPALAAAGVKYVFMDDRAFLASGFSTDRLHEYYLTEADGQTVAVFPIDKALRYLVPFRPPAEIEAYLRRTLDTGGRLAIAADDGEKFGGWPGTSQWVYEDGWLKGFLDLLEGAASWILLQTAGEALQGLRPAGLCYLPTSSYGEMEEWALGQEGGRRLAQLKARLGAESERFTAYIRGGHWKHFLIRYPEANRAHKKGLSLGRLLPARRRVGRARRELLAAQCNDGYWHGIFGGLYLPHLRHEIWRHLARAEALIRRRQTIQVEATDLDCDGGEEVWVHGNSFSAQVQPHRGGRLVEWTDFAEEVNFLNTLTRRPEAYHDAIRDAAAKPGSSGTSGIPGIHDLQREAPADLASALVYDQWERAAFLDHFFVDPHPAASWAAGRLDERGDFTDGLWRWETTSCGVTLHRSGHVRIDPSGDHPVLLRKEYAFADEQRLAVSYRIVNEGNGPLVARFGVELNFFLPGLAFGRRQLVAGDRIFSLDSATCVAGVEHFTLSALEEHPHLTVSLGTPATLYGHLVATVSQSERGYERTVQAVAAMPAWDLRLEPGQEWSGEVKVQVA
jgi:alpha-amylase/alpha-mannosidase (GH57 family)